MEEIKLSIIIPVFNVELYLKRCLDSILKYSTKNIEIILINDGSTDNTLNICEEYKSKYNNIVLINFEQNNGIFIVRNAGLEQAKGKYISFIDSDDYIQDDMLNRLLDIAEATDVDIALCNIKWVTNEDNYKIIKFKGDIYNKIITKEHFKEVYITNGFLFSKIYKRSLFVDNNISFRIYHIEDGLANYEIFKKTTSMYILNEPLYVHAYSIDSLCSRAMNSKDILNRKYSLKYVNDNVSDNDFLKYFNPFFIKDFVVKFMFEYQYPVFYAKILNEEFDKNQRFILFGASNYGRQCLSALEKNGYMNIIFVDNNTKKQNTFIRSYKIISVDQLKEIKKDTDVLIISSQYFVSIAKQLIDNNIISCVSEVLVSKNNTKVKNALKESFEYFLTLENN